MATRKSPKGDEARRRIVSVAESIFAERGLHGAAIREIAGECEMPLASLLHHFPTKERLYSAVLSAIALDLDALLDQALGGGEPHRERLRRVVRDFIVWSEKHPQRSNLLVREILDNPSRLEEAEHLHLKPFLDRFTTFVEDGQKNGQLGGGDPVLFVLHFSGAASWFRAVVPTVEKIFGKKRRAALVKAHREEMLALAERALLPPASSKAPLPLKQRGKV